MDKDIRLNDHGVHVEIVIEWKDNHPGQLGVRHVIYRNISRDFFYTEDLRGFVEDVENDGTVILKDEILIRQGSPIPMLEYPGPIYLDDNYLKVPPYICYIPRATLVRDAFFVEVSAYETLRSNPHAGIAEYRGCIVVDGYVEGIVLKKYKRTLMEAVNQGLEIDKDRIIDIITDAVAHIHSFGLVHNDLNPDNIMLNDNLDPVIIDMETCMAESRPAIYKLGTPGWSDNWWTSSLQNDEVALERIRLWLNGLYNPNVPSSAGGER
jgi:hypothetical protein